MPSDRQWPAGAPDRPVAPRSVHGISAINGRASGALEAPSLPHSEQAEQAVLAGILIDNRAWDRAGELLKDADFYRAEHRLIYGALATLISNGKPADVVTVFEELKTRGKAEESGGLEYLNALAQSVASATNVRRYAEIVRDHSLLRELAAAGDQIRRSALAMGATPAAVHALAHQVLVRSAVHELPLVRQLDHVQSDQLDDDVTFNDELIERTLGSNAMAVMYGDSNCGKTFAGIAMGAAICRGVAWLGRNCRKGLVVYLATESEASVRLRLQAYQRHHRLKVRGFTIVKSPINLFDGDADVSAVIALVGEIEQKAEGKVVLIIGDTLSRISAGANENAGLDMSVVLKHADAIRSATRATFMWIHHCGKDQARGMRGWSGMRAAIDTEIEVTVDEVTGQRAAEVTKQRDLPGKGDRIGFRLDPVHLGFNQWGSPRGSCVVVSADVPAKAARGKRPSEIAGAVTEFLTERGSGCSKGGAVKHFEGRYVRQSVYKEINKMLDAGLLIECAGIIALPGKPGPNP